MQQHKHFGTVVVERTPEYYAANIARDGGDSRLRMNHISHNVDKRLLGMEAENQELRRVSAGPLSPSATSAPPLTHPQHTKYKAKGTALSAQRQWTAPVRH